MSGLIEILLTALAALLLLPVTVFSVEILCALLTRRPLTFPVRDPGRMTVLMPAHNESRGIARALQAISPQLRPGDRILVVADNCQDDTAAVAAANGAEVTERTHLELRGKGYALDHGMRQLRADPPDIVIIMDADCRPAAGALPLLAQACAAFQRPVQALYLMGNPPAAGVKMRIAEFAWLVRNHVRPLGLRTLGFGCQLMGTGMAFPWRLLSPADLATGHIVEDMKLGLDLARAGAAPLFLVEARVDSEFPTAAEGIAGQRTRWEHGHLGVIVSEGPRTLFESLRRGNAGLLALTLDFCVPPLALLGMLQFMALLAAAIFTLATGRPLPAIVALAGLAMFLASVLGAWLRYGRHAVSAKDFLAAALYALAKIPMYLRFLIARQVSWVRSKREGE